MGGKIIYINEDIKKHLKIQAALEEKSIRELIEEIILRYLKEDKRVRKLISESKNLLD